MNEKTPLPDQEREKPKKNPKVVLNGAIPYIAKMAVLPSVDLPNCYGNYTTGVNAITFCDICFFREPCIAEAGK